MLKRKVWAVLIFSLVLSFCAVINTGSETVLDTTEIYNFSFDDQNGQGEYVSVGLASEIEWVSGVGVGHDDDSAIKVTHGDNNNYNSYDNAVRLTFPEQLSVGGTYHISAWIYAPTEGNEGKSTLTGPGFVVDGKYEGAQGVTKFPVNFGTLPLDEWKEINVELPTLDEAVSYFDFRLVTNDEPNHPDVWYIDNVVVSLVGEIEDTRIPEWDLSLPSLKDTFSDYFAIGNIMEPSQTTEADTTEMFNHHYNFVTAENAMKPTNLTKSKGEYSFSGADSFVNWAEANDQSVHGHTLVWHSQSASWLTDDSDGQPLTREEAKANMEDYINTVAGRYAGRIYSWDVVNEAFQTSVGGNVSDWKTALRSHESGSDGSPWYKAYENGADESKGEHASDYIYDAFVFARIADPNAVLYYNDFNETTEGKRNAIASMVEELNEKWADDERNTEPDRLLIEGIGMQAHYWTGDLKAENVEATIKRFAETGAIISVSELDIPLGSWSSYGEPTERHLEFQAELYSQVFEVYLKYADNIERVTFWGKTDPQSWRGQGYPLLFDNYYEAKDSYWAVISATGEHSADSSGDDDGDDDDDDDGDADDGQDDGDDDLDSVEDGADDGTSGGVLIWILIIGGVGAAIAVGVVIFLKMKK